MSVKSLRIGSGDNFRLNLTQNMADFLCRKNTDLQEFIVDGEHFMYVNFNEKKFQHTYLYSMVKRDMMDYYASHGAEILIPKMPSHPANRISTDKFFQLGVSADKLKGIPLHIVDLNQASTERIEAEISKMKIKNEVAGFYLDYLQLLEPVKSDKAKPKIEQMTNISKQLAIVTGKQIGRAHV